MKPEIFHRLQSLRLENEAAGCTMKEMAPRFDRMGGRHENGTAPRAVVAYQLFQTPAELAEKLVERLGIQYSSRVLEPSAGLGRLLDAIQSYGPAEIVAVEVNPGCAGELFRQERQGVVIQQQDFLTVVPGEFGWFDAVAMNPPFHMGSDAKHIRLAFSHLRSRGRLASIASATTGIRLQQWVGDLGGEIEALPAASFKAEGTRVDTVMITVEKP